MEPIQTPLNQQHATDHLRMCMLFISITGQCVCQSECNNMNKINFQDMIPLPFANCHYNN